MQVITYDQVEQKIIEIRGQKVILDSDVAELYGVETKRINEAVKNNRDKFPIGYLLELVSQEKMELVENFDRFNNLKHATSNPKVFTERGLYMLATILKSPQAVETTLAIIDTFAKTKTLTGAIYKFNAATTDEQKVQLFEIGSDLFIDLLDNELIVSQRETEIKLKLPFFELKRTITKIKK